MSVHPLLRRPTAAVPVEVYFQHDKAADPLVALRPLSALEQMYAYWGADRA